MMFREPSCRSRRAGLVSSPERRRRHHPDFNMRDTQGWKALEAEGKTMKGCAAYADAAPANP